MEFKQCLPSYSTLVVLVIVLVQISRLTARELKEANEENCEVCVKFLKKFMNELPKDIEGDANKIMAEFKRQCTKKKGADERLCYYVGGREDSATSILSDISKLMSYPMDPEKICHRAYKKDNQICEMRYPKQIDLKNTDLNKLRVKELKKILEEWDEGCKGCMEKSDYVKRIQELMPKYAPDSVQKNEL